MALYPEGTAPLPMDDVQRGANKANELSRQALGQSGSVVLSGTGNASGAFVALQFLASTVVVSLTAPGITGVANLQGTYSAGTTIYGDFRAVSITSGLVIAYKA
jgi:hypothetical protein